MPILDGDRLLQAMRSKIELRSIPIIMVTADAVCSFLAFVQYYI